MLLKDLTTVCHLARARALAIELEHHVRNHPGGLECTNIYTREHGRYDAALIVGRQWLLDAIKSRCAELVIEIDGKLAALGVTTEPPVADPDFKEVGEP